MSMNEFRRLAAKIDQHMQQLSAQGVNDPHAIINRMIGYVPDLHKIWVRTSDDQLIALSNEFPGFYRYALIMECVRKSGVGGVGVAWAHASDNTLQTPDFTSCSAQC
jgi:hypothetical protein